MALTYLAMELILLDLVTDTGSNQTGHPMSAATKTDIRTTKRNRICNEFIVQ